MKPIAGKQNTKQPIGNIMQPMTTGVTTLAPGVGVGVFYRIYTTLVAENQQSQLTRTQRPRTLIILIDPFWHTDILILKEIGKIPTTMEGTIQNQPNVDAWRLVSTGTWQIPICYMFCDVGV